MKEKEIRERLRKSAQNVQIPDVLDNVKRSAYSFDNAKITASNEIKTGVRRRKRTFALAGGLSAALLVATIILVAIVGALGFDAEVFARVNVQVVGAASYTLDVNRGSKVIDITADSEEASEVISDIKFKGRDFELVATDVLKAFVDRMGITEEQLSNNEVVFSVDCHDSSAKNKLEHSLETSLTAAKQHCKNKHQGGNHGHHD